MVTSRTIRAGGGEVDHGPEGDGRTDTSVNVTVAIDGDRGKDPGQRRRRAQALARVTAFVPLHRRGVEVQRAYTYRDETLP